MTGELTTRPMLEALLEGQRQLSLQMADALASISEKQDAIAAKQDALNDKQDALAAKQDALDARQDRLEVRVTELISRVEDGFDDTNRKIEIFNDRLLSFETWLKKVDRRLHDEILVRTR
jgi:peptidoglycan hydrolase CwlO-like protein